MVLGNGMRSFILVTSLLVFSNGKKNNDRHKTMDAQRIEKYPSYVMLFTITSKHNGSIHNQEITHFVYNYTQQRHAKL